MTLIQPVILNGFETWALKKAEEVRLESVING